MGQMKKRGIADFKEILLTLGKTAKMNRTDRNKLGVTSGPDWDRLTQNYQTNLDNYMDLADEAGVAVDEAIRHSSIVATIKKQSQEAKKEADRLANDARTIAQLTALTNKLTGVVTQIRGL